MGNWWDSVGICYEWFVGTPCNINCTSFRARVTNAIVAPFDLVALPLLEGRTIWLSLQGLFRLLFRYLWFIDLEPDIVVPIVEVTSFGPPRLSWPLSNTRIPWLVFLEMSREVSNFIDDVWKTLIVRAVRLFPSRHSHSQSLYLTKKKKKSIL